jgi:hypothetical protein
LQKGWAIETAARRRNDDGANLSYSTLSACHGTIAIVDPWTDNTVLRSIRRSGGQFDIRADAGRVDAKNSLGEGWTGSS